MNIIIKHGERVFALSLDRADLRAILLAVAWAFHPGLPPLSLQGLVAGSGMVPHALVQAFNDISPSDVR